MSYMLLVLYYTDSIVLFTVVNIVYDDLDDFIQLTRYYYDGSIQYWQLAYITYWYKYHITYMISTSIINYISDTVQHHIIQLTRYYYDGSIQYWQLAYITYWYKYHITYINRYHQLYIWYSTTPYNIADDDYDSSIQSRYISSWTD